MDGFSSMPALSNGGNTGDPLVLNVNPGGQSLGLDAFDPDMPFDDGLLDTVNNGLQIPFTPSYDFDNFSNFEDPFSSYSAPRPYDATAHVNAAGLGVHTYQHESTEMYGHTADSPQELDNKLLGFSAPVPSGKAHLIDGDTGQLVTDLDMAAELFGMFFVAEDVYNAEPNTSRPLELTCYRRNLWQCSGQLTLPRHITQLVDENGRQVPIAELAASITAVESIEGKSTEIISIPWKSAAAAAAAAAANNGAGSTTQTQSTEEAAKVASAPPRVTLDLAAAAEAEGNESDGQRVTVPVSWKRLQFKHATANNGRRKGLQQHYVVQINLLARCAATGAESPSAAEFIKIAEIQSGPVIVRGRSPRNFDSRKDVPLTGNSMANAGGMGERKPGRSMSNDTQGSAMGTMQKADRTELAQNLQKYHSLGNLQQTGIDWTTAQAFGTNLPQQQHPPKKMALASPSLTRPPVPAWSSQDSVVSNTTPTPTHKQLHSTPTKAGLVRGGSSGNVAAGPTPTLPINLSLSEDERSPNRSTSDTMSSPQLTTKMASVGGLAGDGTRASPIEDGELLYEYFPLSLDDWMPPVDAIYRPHVVHHTVVPPEVQAQQSRNRTKRYFMPD